LRESYFARIICFPVQKITTGTYDASTTLPIIIAYFTVERRLEKAMSKYDPCTVDTTLLT